MIYLLKMQTPQIGLEIAFFKVKKKKKKNY